MKPMLLIVVFALGGCAASPEKVRGDELVINAMYESFDCQALATEAKVLEAEIERAQAVVDSPSQWVPIVNIFTLPSQIRGIQDLESAKARRSGVWRAMELRNCPIETPNPPETQTST